MEIVDALARWADGTLGLSAEDLSWGQMGLRAALAFVLLIVLVRLGNKRLFAKGSAVDLVVSIMVGSTMAKSITTAGPVLPVYVAVAVLILMHSLLSYLAARVRWFAPLVKGSSVRLVRRGDLLEGNMNDSAITIGELETALRGQGEEPDVSRIEDAWLERDGSLTVHAREEERAPRVVDVTVRDGVQTVRVELA